MEAHSWSAAVQCEMCGETVPRTRKFLVDRSILQVCSKCERFGKPLEAGPGQPMPVAPGNVGMALEKRRRLQSSRDVYSGMQMELVPDYAARIKAAREKKGLTRQQLGAAVGEREVVMGRYEQGTLNPPDDVAKKLERELGIKLYEAIQTGVTQKSTARSMTLGDMLRDAMNKKKGE